MKIVYFILLTCISVSAIGQVKTADLSPRAELEQEVGLTEFEVEYSRPSARERKVMGGIVPFDKMWRTGANMNTTISFDSEIYINNDTVPSGEYSVFTIPNEKEWKIFFYDKTGISGVPRDWDEDLIVMEFTAKAKKLNDFVETFTISFDALQTDQCNLVLSWENTAVEVPIKLPTVELTKESIADAMAGPSDRDFYLAASFYLDQNENLDKALKYINKAVKMRGEEAFWYTRKQALILYANGKIEEAIQAAENSKKSAEKVNYTSYVEMNKADIEKWKKELGN
jgi:hypothetical protein